ncbi:MAG TPA: ricin-type beta-trefoil lectin domain protein, partial [Lentzea sp.]
FLEPEDERAADIGGDSVLAQRDPDGTSKWDVLRWTPAECDTSIYPDGWFYPYTSIKTPAQLEDTYYTSVGRNCQLLLNVGPDRHGLLDGPTVEALTSFGTTISSTFGTDFARGASTSAPAAVDGDPDTSWQLGSTTGSAELNLGGDRTFDVITIQEDMAVGMRTQSFAVDRWTGSGWTEIATDTTVGYKKLVRLASPVTTSRVRLRITGSRAAPAIATFGLHSRPTRSGPVTSGLAGKCLDTDGTRAQIWDCRGINWTAAPDGSLQAFGKCLDIYGGSSSNGALIQLYPCNGLGHQKWTASGDALVNPQSGRCLDVPGFNSANGTQLVLWDCNGGANQRWTFTTGR